MSDAPRPAVITPLAARLGTLAQDRTLVVAHRGASDQYPENTVPAFAAAIAAGAELVEFDVQVTRDGMLVCLHDETLDRTTDARSALGGRDLRVADLDWAAVRHLDAGAWKGPARRGARVPSLREGLAAIVAGAVPMLERKGGSAEAVVSLLRDAGLVDRVLVQSFDWEWLRAVRRLEPALTLGALGEDPLDAATHAAIDALGVAFVHWDWRTVRSEDVASLHARGYLTCVYTVDPDLALLGAMAAGVRMVTTNHAARLVELRRQHGGSRPTRG